MVSNHQKMLKLLYILHNFIVELTEVQYFLEMGIGLFLSIDCFTANFSKQIMIYRRFNSISSSLFGPLMFINKY